MTFRIFILFFALLPYNLFSTIKDIEALILSANKYKEEFKHDSSYFLYSQALDLANSSPNISIKKKYSIQFELASALERYNKNPKALNKLLALKDELEETQYTEIYAHTLISISLLYEKLGYENECFQYLNKAKNTIFDNQLNPILPRYYLRLASAYRVNSKPDSAFFNIELAIKTAQQHKEFEILATSRVVKGFLIIRKNTFQAYNLFTQGLKYYQEKQDLHGVTMVYNAFINDYLYRNKNDSALMYSNLSAQIINKNTFINALPYHYKLRSIIYENMNNPDSALVYLKKSQTLEINQIYNQKESEILDITKKYNKLIHEKLITSQKEIISNKNTHLKVIIIITSILLISLLILSYLFSQKTKLNKRIINQNGIIKDKTERLKVKINQEQFLMRELHHRVKNNLQIIISLLDLQDEEGNQDIINRIYCIATFHNLLYNNDSFDRICIKNYLEELSYHILKSANIENKIKIESQVISKAFSLETLIPIGLLFNELITNSIKHAKPNHNTLILNIHISESTNKYLLTYFDNGLGFNLNNYLKNKSFGVFVIESMILQLEGTLEINETNGIHYNISFKEKN